MTLGRIGVDDEPPVFLDVPGPKLREHLRGIFRFTVALHGTIQCVFAAYGVLINKQIRLNPTRFFLSAVVCRPTMSFRSLSLCLLLLRFHPIFGPRALAASDAAGKINLYNDYDCNHPSSLNPTVTLPLSTCLVTTGGEGLVIAEFPPCPQSTATLIYYQDVACGVPTSDVSTSIFAQNCFQLASGTDLYNARAVMFSCQPAANNPQPSSTTTAVVSALAAVATGSTESNGSGSSTSAAGSTPTDTSTQKNSTDSSGSNSNGGTRTSTSTSTGTSTSTSTSTSSGSGSGLNTGDIIALVVGLGIGIPTIVIMLAAWLFPDFRHTLRSWLSGGLNQLAFQRNEPHQRHYNDMQEMHSWQQPVQPYGR